MDTRSVRQVVTGCSTGSGVGGAEGVARGGAVHSAQESRLHHVSEWLTPEKFQ